MESKLILFNEIKIYHAQRKIQRSKHNNIYKHRVNKSVTFYLKSFIFSKVKIQT
jgi:hypothetical protein